jgi:UDP-N-acetylglucosamine:LPS N-acetylglucosamine transferase
LAAVPPRVLILTASVGEGHDLPARTLAAQLREERPDAEVDIEDCLAVMGRTVAFASEGAAHVVFYRFEWAWDVGFWFATTPPPTRELTQRLFTRLGAPGLLRLIERHDPDVIVSVYPNVTEVLGRLRRAGRLGVPVVAAITDLAAMHYWASRGVDVHLVTHAESVEEVRAIVGADAPVHCVHGLTAPAFRVPRPQADARRALGLPAEGKVVLVSGGGWGVGDVEGAVAEALAVPRSGRIVCLCGRNETLLTELRARFGGDPRVRLERFTDVMPEWLAAGDVLVHSTGGLTVLEALMRGCPAISYGWGRGHVRVNNAAFRSFGLAQVAETRAELRVAIERALVRGRTVTDGFDRLPSAASFVLAAADAR